MGITVPFGWFYLTSLILIAVYLIWYGNSRKYPMTTWLTLVAWVIILSLFGMKLMVFPIREWPEILSHQGPVYQKFLPGAFLFFIAGLALARKFLNFRAPAVHGLILFLPIIEAVQRIGCFINGCCYGTETTLPWAVHYHEGSSAYLHYLEAGRFSATDLSTPGLHPVQLYITILMLAVFVTGWILRNRWKSTGGRVWFGVSLLLTVRIITEFFREHDSWKWYSGTFLGFNYLQWLTLGILILSILLLIRSERRPSTQDAEAVTEYPARNAILLLALIFLVWNLGPVLEPQELILAVLLLASAVIPNLLKVLRMGTAPAVRYGTAALLLVAFGTMSQKLVENQADSLKKDPAKFWVSLGVNGSAGEYENVVRNCSGNVVRREPMAENSAALNLSAHLRPNSRALLEAGATGFMVNNHHTSSLVPRDEINHYGINPYLGLSLGQKDWVEGRIGWNFFHNPHDTSEYSNYSLPTLYFRIGPENIFFADFGFADEITVTGKPSIAHAGFGFGIKRNPDYLIRFGVSNGQLLSWTDDDFHLYLGGEFRIADRLYLKPSVYLFNQYFGTLGITWRMGK